MRNTRNDDNDEAEQLYPGKLTPPNLTPPRSAAPATQSKPADSQEGPTPGTAACATYQASNQSSGTGTSTGASKDGTPVVPHEKEAPKKDKHKKDGDKK